MSPYLRLRLLQKNAAAGRCQIQKPTSSEKPMANAMSCNVIAHSFCPLPSFSINTMSVRSLSILLLAAVSTTLPAVISAHGNDGNDAVDGSDSPDGRMPSSSASSSSTRNLRRRMPIHQLVQIIDSNRDESIEEVSEGDDVCVDAYSIMLNAESTSRTMPHVPIVHLYRHFDAIFKSHPQNISQFRRHHHPSEV